MQHPVDIAGTITPPVEATDSVLQTVTFWDFSDAGHALAFYNKAPLAARLDLAGILAFQPLAGSTGVPSPSRGLDEMSCLEKLPNGITQSSGGKVMASGQCSRGSLSSIGVATILTRGSVVVIAESIATTFGSVAASSALSKNASLASSALKLLQTVGLG